jgi:ubiquinone/menaquinone biosynthesis C-methylase UbiE
MKLQFNQTDYWNSVAGEKNFTHKIRWDWLDPLLDSQAKILDYGCGYGRLTNEILNHGYKNVIGIDNSKAMIERGKKEFQNLTLFQNQKEGIDFPDNEFGLVILFAVLTCISLDIDQKNLIKEFIRVLKPNGILYVSDFLINPDERNTNRYNACEQGPYGTFQLSGGVTLRHHDIIYLQENIFADFNILYENTFDVTTMNGNTSKAIQTIGRNQKDKS